MLIVPWIQPPCFGNQEFAAENCKGLLPISAEETRAPEVVAGNAIVQTAGTIIFFARVLSRFLIINSWKPEDSILVIAWVRCPIIYEKSTIDRGCKLFATAYSICQYGQVKHGAGRHLISILQENPSDTVESQKYAFAAQVIVLLALALPKLSICLTYLRIFHSDVRGRRMIRSLIVLVVVPSLLFLILTFFQCKPIQVYWTEGRPASKCSTDISGVYVSGSLNVLVDVALMAIVLPRVLELHLHARQKSALVGIVSLGSFAAIAGLIRMIRVGTTLSKPNFDPTWDAYDISIWTSTEIYVSLVCASAPGIKPIVAKVLPKLLGSSLNSRSRTRTSVNAPGSIELSLKQRRGTIGSNRVRTHQHDTVLGDEEGFYEQLGHGIDRVSPRVVNSADKAEEFPGLESLKTAQASVRTGVLL